MEQIAPLARILAEANGIEWQRLRGSGEGGTVVEQDILNYLTRIMSGEEEPPATPVDAMPDGWTGEDDALPPGMFSADMLSQAGVDSDIAAFVEQSRVEARPASPRVPATAARTSLDSDALEFELDDLDGHGAGGHDTGGQTVTAQPDPALFVDEVAGNPTSPDLLAPPVPIPPVSSVMPQASAPQMAAPQVPVPEVLPPAAPAPAPARPAMALGNLLSQLYRKDKTPEPAPVPPAEVSPVAATPEIEAPQVTEAPQVETPRVELPQPTAPVLAPEVPAAAVEATEPVLAEQTVAQPEASQPEVSQPEVSQPELVQPEATEPEVTDVYAATHDPEVANLEVAAPEMVAPAQAAPPQPVSPVFTSPVPASPVPASPAPGGAVWFGTYLRRDANVAAAGDLRAQLSEALDKDVSLAFLVARAAGRHAGLLNLGGVALQGEDGQARPVQGGALRDAVSALGSGYHGTPGLLVVDAGALSLDELHYPHTVTLSVGRVQGGRAALSLNGDVDARQAAQFLGRVAEALEKPIALVL